MGHKVLVGFGIGENYIRTKAVLGDMVKLDFLMDRRWEDNDEAAYDGVPIMRMKELAGLKHDAKIVIFPRHDAARRNILASLSELQAEVCFASEIFPVDYTIMGGYCNRCRYKANTKMTGETE